MNSRRRMSPPRLECTMVSGRARAAKDQKRTLDIFLLAQVCGGGNIQADALIAHRLTICVVLVPFFQDVGLAFPMQPPSNASVKSIREYNAARRDSQIKQHVPSNPGCPLYPRKQTYAEGRTQRTNATAFFPYACTARLNEPSSSSESLW